jgi:multidrug efflux system outer membrane protein
MKKNICFLTFLIFLLSGCTLGPSYKCPKVTVPKTWKEPHLVKAPIKHFDYWWEIFEDDELNCLELQAVKFNKNLAISIEKVLQARAKAGISEADLFPQLNLQPNYSNYIALLYFPIPGAQDVKRIHMVTYELPLNASYELDLWGKISGKYHSAYQNAQSQEAAYLTSLLTLTADLAASYFKIRCLDKEIELLQETIRVDKEDLDLVNLRYEKGLIGLLDVTYATQTINQDEASLFESERLREIEVNKIAILIGRPSSCVAIKRKSIDRQPPEIPAGIPSTILLKRPDILQAERMMASEHSMIGVAYASFYPSIELTGSLGYSSPTLGDFLTWPSRLWAIGTNINEVIFDGGRNQANLNLAYANYRQALASYQQTILTAFQEVEDALNDIEKEAKQYQKLDLALKAAEKTVELTTLRYEKGYSNYFEVFNSKKIALTNATNLNSLLSLRYLATIELIKALGGRFETTLRPNLKPLDNGCEP